MTTDKKIINVEAERIDLAYMCDCDTPQTFEYIINFLEGTKSKLEMNGYTNLSIRIYRCGYDGGFEWAVYGDRLENDKEYKARLNQEQRDAIKQQKLKEKKDKEDLALYKKLKKKFGDV
jgi:hypothetical protein